MACPLISSLIAGRNSSSTQWTPAEEYLDRERRAGSGSMEGDSRFRYGGVPSRMDRPLDQYLMTPVHSTLTHPRLPQTVAMGVANPLDLTSAIAHELRRSHSQPGWLPLNPQLGGVQTSLHETENSLQMSYGSLLSHQQVGATSRQQLIPQYIPSFDEGLQGPAPMQQMPVTYDSYTTESESFVSARQEFYSRSGNGLSSPQPPQQGIDTARVDSMRSCSPWIERMMQSDVTGTPCPSGPGLGNSTSLRLAQRGAAGEAVSCVASQTIDLQSCHSSDMQQRSEKSMRSAFSYDSQHEFTVELSADLCTDDEDLETRPMEVKRKKRMLSNRASAQRSRQRRQERLDQLEVLTAQLRVENSTLQKKYSAAIQLAKKFEEQNKNLVKKVDRLSKGLNGGNNLAKTPVAAFDECASSQQTTCASSCEMVGGRLSVDPNLMRDGNMNDGASTPSMSPRSSGWPSGTSPTENEGDMDAVSNGNGAAVSTVRKSLSACRMGSKKRSHDQSEAPAAFGVSRSTSIGNHMGYGCLGFMASQPSRPRPTSPPTGIGGGSTSFLEPSRCFSHEVCYPLGLDPSMKDDSNLDCLEADRWLEFADCFL